MHSQIMVSKSFFVDKLYRRVHIQLWGALAALDAFLAHILTLLQLLVLTVSAQC